MIKKLPIILTLVLVLAFALSACERSASQVTLPTPTGDSGLALSGSGQPLADDPMAMLETYATQTAMALNGTSSLSGTQTPTTGTPPVATNQTPVGTGTSGLPSPTPTLPVGVVVVTPTSTRVSGPTPVIIRPATYTLNLGEYPFCIARRFNVSQYELLALNGLSLSEGTNLPVGYTLKIPQTGTPFEGARALLAHPITYTVQGDETVYKIACSFGDIDPSAIIAANALVAPYTLRVGQTLNIP